MKFLKFLPLVALVAIALMSCGAQLPQADVDAANASFAAAGTAQADVYAADSYKAAKDANDALQANLSAKDYSKTKDLSKALLDASDKAKSDAEAAIATVKDDATGLSTSVPAIDQTVSAELAAATKAGKKAKIDLVAVKTAVDAAEKAVADGKTALDAGNFADAKTQYSAAQDALTAQQKVLEDAGFKK